MFAPGFCLGLHVWRWGKKNLGVAPQLTDTLMSFTGTGTKKLLELASLALLTSVWKAITETHLYKYCEEFMEGC